VELDLHLLDLRFEGLRTKDLAKEQRLLASLARVGQQLPVVVVAGDELGRHVLVDGYKRVRVLRRLRVDTVLSTTWALDQADALLLERLMRTADPDGPLQQGWLLVELQERFGLTQGELARRFDKSASWVSRRLSLVRELPESIQTAVRDGRLSSHVATRLLVPLARAKRDDACRLGEAMARLGLSTRDAQRLHRGFLDSGTPGRALILEQPEVYLRAENEAKKPATHAPSPIEQMTGDLGALAGIAQRACRRLGDGRLRRALTPDREHVDRMAKLAQRQAQQLFERIQSEIAHAG
jgi:ParB-like chromosome segregation protein Spo0J